LATAKEVIEEANADLGCLGKAHDDEPVFVLRAQDVFAPQLVEAWANLARVSAPEKAAQAIVLAAAMRVWHTRKLPD
jgi:hypothetical protein